MENILEIRNVSKRFVSDKREVLAVDNITFNVRYNEFLSIVGPSGCGKSTLLRMIAGLEKPTSGEILWRVKR